MTKHSNKRLAFIILSICVVLACAIIAGLAATGRLAPAYEAAAGTEDVDIYDEEEEEEFDGIYMNGVKYSYNTHLSNYLFMGVDLDEQVDTTEGRGDAGQADAIYLLSWNRLTGDVTVVGIPRDTMTKIEVYSRTGTDLGTATDHISLSYAYGDGKHTSCRLTVQAVQNLLYDIPILGYCSLSVDSMPVLADSVGGVDVVIPNDSLEYLGEGYEEGSTITVDGDNAEVFLRRRDTTEDESAIARMERQKAFLAAFATKAEAVFSADPKKLTTLLTDLDPYMVSNIGNDIYVKIVDGISDGGTTSYWTVPGESVVGEIYDEYYADDDALKEKIVETFYVVAE